MVKISELVPIKKGKTFQKCISARDLHYFLESKQQFSDWIKSRIKKYQFVVNIDYTSFHNSMKRENGATTRIEYCITLDMAKELAMVENNEKGRQARRYFIECEKQLKQPLRIPSQLEQQRLILQLLEQQEKDQPKIEYHDRVLATKGSFPITHIAKEMGMSAIKLNKILAAKGVQYKISGQWVLTEGYADEGYTEVSTILWEDRNGNEKSRHHTKWTEKGRNFIHNLLNPTTNA